MTHIPYPSNYFGEIGIAHCDICETELSIDDEGVQDEYTNSIYCDDCYVEVQRERLYEQLLDFRDEVCEMVHKCFNDSYRVEEGWKEHEIVVWKENRWIMILDLEHHKMIFPSEYVDLDLTLNLGLIHKVINPHIYDYQYVLKRLENL